ncbi:MAG TPA: MFS transporter, partial [Candidatus Lokiarchaeia archaeon]|nr:MFS transporter [Candidatus Lokiarchaeia archaeon]
YNVVYAVMAFYMGRLGDRMSKQKLIVVGLCVLVGVAVLAALPYNPSVFSMWVMVGIFLLLGVYIGIIDPSSSAFVSDITGKDKKGHAYALYYLLVGLISIPEGLIFGALYDAYGPTFAFSFEGVIIFVCIIIFARADFETRLKEVRASYSVPTLV